MKSALKLFIGFSFGSWINALISLISIPVITWLISPAEFGKATMFTIAYNLIINFVLLGSDQSFIRFYNDKSPEDRHVLLKNSLIPPLGFLCVIGFLLYTFKESVSIALFSSKDDVVLVYALIFSLFIGVFSQFGFTLVRMKSRAIEYSLLQILSSVANVIIIVVYAILIDADFKSVIIGFIGSTFLALIVSIFMERQSWGETVKGVFRTDSQLLIQILMYGLPFVPTFLSAWVFQSSDRTFLRIYSSFTEIGLFAAATKIANSLNVIKSGFTAYWVPFSYENFVKSPSQTEMYSKVFNLLSVAFFSFIIVLISCTEFVLTILPDSYAGTSLIFPILFFVPLLYTLSEVTSVGINFKKKPFWHMAVVTISAVVNIIFGFLLIPVYGALGAAISTLIAYFIFFASRSYISIKLYPVKYHWFRFIASSLITTAVLLVHILIGTNSLTILLNLFSVLVIAFIYKNDIVGFTKRMSFKEI